MILQRPDPKKQWYPSVRKEITRGQDPGLVQILRLPKGRTAQVLIGDPAFTDDTATIEDPDHPTEASGTQEAILHTTEIEDGHHSDLQNPETGDL